MNSSRSACRLGFSMLTTIFGIEGTASGLHRQVTKTDMCRSRFEPGVAAVLAISVSCGANHSIQPVDVELALVRLRSTRKLTERPNTPHEFHSPRPFSVSATALNDPPNDVIE